MFGMQKVNGMETKEKEKKVGLSPFHLHQKMKGKWGKRKRFNEYFKCSKITLINIVRKNLFIFT